MLALKPKIPNSILVDECQLLYFIGLILWKTIYSTCPVEEVLNRHRQLFVFKKLLWHLKTEHLICLISLISLNLSGVTNFVEICLSIMQCRVITKLFPKESLNHCIPSQLLWEKSHLFVTTPKVMILRERQ